MGRGAGDGVSELVAEPFVEVGREDGANHSRLEEPLAFERLLTRICSRLVTGNAVGEEVERGLQLLAQFFQVDRCTFWELSANGQQFSMTHSYNHGGDTIPTIVDGNALPWFFQQLLAGRPVCLESMADLPVDAAEERRYWLDHHLKSALLVPLQSGNQLKGCFSLAAMNLARRWSADLVQRLQLAGELFANALARKRLEEAKAVNASFEYLLARISARFLNLPNDQVHQVIQEAQEQVCQCLGCDASTLWQRIGSSGDLTLTHFYRRFEGPLPPEQMRAGEYFPWSEKQLLANQVVVVPSTEDVPPEAAHDREVWRYYGVKTSLGIPLSTGGGAVIGVLSFNDLKQERSWTEELVKRLQLVAQVFTNALVRKQTDEVLRESEERFRTLVENAGDGFELLDAQGRFIDVNSATIKQLGYTRDELLGLSVFDIDPSLTPQVFSQTTAHLAPGLSVRVQSVHRRKDGTTFPVEVTVSKVQLKGNAHVLTLVHDITERKLAEQALLKSYAEIEKLKDRLQAETDYLKEEIKVTLHHGEIIGSSRVMKKVLHKVELVGATDSSVLVTGETGVGKELIANAIHQASRRKGSLMVTVNCAALPSTLVESELFGRERGAYTGALNRQAGRFELAHNSTIFLDEIGELSLDVQAKLLRVLETGEFERLGSTKTFKVDVRLIAATNRNLREEVRKRRFREDLFYRLNVFPIDVPPLRARTEDIPELVWTFVQEFGKRMGKMITRIPKKAMLTLQEYPWPGNVRQLRNVIEHSVIVTTGEILQLTIPDEPLAVSVQPMTLAENEREHILRTLEANSWHIKGPKGAAQKLGMKPSTLYTRMKKLKIPNRSEKLGCSLPTTETTPE